MIHLLSRLINIGSSQNLLAHKKTDFFQLFYIFLKYERLELNGILYSLRLANTIRRLSLSCHQPCQVTDNFMKASFLL